MVPGGAIGLVAAGVKVILVVINAGRQLAGKPPAAAGNVVLFTANPDPPAPGPAPYAAVGAPPTLVRPSTPPSTLLVTPSALEANVYPPPPPGP